MSVFSGLGHAKLKVSRETQNAAREPTGGLECKFRQWAIWPSNGHRGFDGWVWVIAIEHEIFEFVLGDRCMARAYLHLG